MDYKKFWTQSKLLTVSIIWIMLVFIFFNCQMTAIYFWHYSTVRGSRFPSNSIFCFNKVCHGSLPVNRRAVQVFTNTLVATICRMSPNSFFYVIDAFIELNLRFMVLSSYPDTLPYWPLMHLIVFAALFVFFRF